LHGGDSAKPDAFVGAMQTDAIDSEPGSWACAYRPGSPRPDLRGPASGETTALRLLAMNADRPRRWTDRSCLQQVQYRTDANLAARQSLYAYQYPRIDLPAAVLGLSSLRGQEIVADIGCGNGSYLAELARRRHTGPVVGVDLSAGMLAAARRRAPAAALTAADAAALPLRDHAVSLTLAAHMLYHVPDSRAAAGELRRITRPGGQVLVVLNGPGHLRELHDLIAATLQITPSDPPLGDRLRLDLDDGQNLLASQFASVVRHDFTSELQIPEPESIENYVRSMISIQDQPDPAAVAAAVASRLPTSAEPFRIRTHTGCLVCA
jgi:ubiquinone/menaquinone biosynthesis C-methylase UbiE